MVEAGRIEYLNDWGGLSGPACHSLEVIRMTLVLALVLSKVGLRATEPVL
jgi:hypothetical protein